MGMEGDYNWDQRHNGPKKVFIRIDDGERFTLNEDGKTYSLEMMKKDFPGHLHHKYEEHHLTGEAFRFVME